jgi:hypothetical protein
MSGPDAQSMKTMIARARVALEQIGNWLMAQMVVRTAARKAADC